MLAMDSAQNVSSQARPATESQKLACVRQRHHGVLTFLELAMEPNFELLLRHVRQKFVVELLKRQTKLRAKLIECNFRKARLLEDVIRRFPHRGQIVHRRTRSEERRVGKECR